MEMDKLKIIVLSLVLIGLVTGAGILILDKFSQSSSVTNVETRLDENLSWKSIGTNITLSHGNITLFTQITNETGAVLTPSNYSVNAVMGVVQILGNSTICRGGNPCYADYKWRNYGTPAATALTNARNSISDIPATWLSLIVTIAVLSIILTLIIRSFGGQR